MRIHLLRHPYDDAPAHSWDVASPRELRLALAEQHERYCVAVDCARGPVLVILNIGYLTIRGGFDLPMRDVDKLWERCSITIQREAAMEAFLGRIEKTIIQPAVYTGPRLVTDAALEAPLPRSQQSDAEEQEGERPYLAVYVPPLPPGGRSERGYPGVIQRGPAIAVLDGSHYAISTPYDPAFLSLLKQLPAARWDRTRRAWFVRKRWHRQIRRTLEEIASLDAERREHLRSLCAHLDLRLDSYSWAHRRDDGSVAIDLPPGLLRGPLFALLRELDATAGVVPARRIENLTLLAEELDGEIRQAWADEKLRDESREEERQRARDAEQARLEAARLAGIAADAAHAARMAGRLLIHADTTPAIGALIDVRGEMRRVVEVGRVFGGEAVTTVFGRQITPRTRYVYTEAL